MIISVVAIGHISTKHLAAAALGSMTAVITGFGFISGSCSALDTVLPSAWTSSTPQLVGLWTQRMGMTLLV
jgi:multidrug resistance protein, MATE family